MAENKIAEVVKLLDVEIGEEFLVFNDMGELVGKHKFDDKGLWLIYGDKIGSINQHLIYLLNGAWKIKKKPWKPKMRQPYWTYIRNGIEVCVSKYYWHEGFQDMLFYRNGFVYKTETEAKTKENIKRAEKYFASDDIIDWEQAVK